MCVVYSLLFAHKVCGNTQGCLASFFGSGLVSASVDGLLFFQMVCARACIPRVQICYAWLMDCLLCWWMWERYISRSNRDISCITPCLPLGAYLCCAVHPVVPLTPCQQVFEAKAKASPGENPHDNLDQWE